MKRTIAFALVAVGMLSACSDPKTDIIGRWESPVLSIGGVPMYTQFNDDKTMKYSTVFGQFQADWMFLESGQLQLSYPSGKTVRCTVEFQSRTDGTRILLKPGTCMHGMQDVVGDMAYDKV